MGLAATVALSACGEAIPTPPLSPTLLVSPVMPGLTVDAALQHFKERTLGCIGPDAPSVDERQWLCAHESGTGEVYHVRITGSTRGVSELFATVEHPPDGEKGEELVTSFFASSVAAIPYENSQPKLAEEWALSAHRGGIANFGGVRFEIRGAGELRSISLRALAPVDAAP